MPNSSFDVVIVGAGFAGLCALHHMRELGLSACVFEAGAGVGGTWYWNRYPGARCDIESMEYSYQFSEDLQQEWTWSERYASQREILAYLEHVANRFDLRGDIVLATRVVAAHFDEHSSRWRITTDRGDEVAARYCVMATGCLSSVNRPPFEGMDAFRGAIYHTGDWPHEPVDFSGRRVGVIGTGSSAIQAIPIIAEQAGHLYVFQRTPNYSIPAHNGPLDPQTQAKIKADYAKFRRNNSRGHGGAGFRHRADLGADATPEERRAEFEYRWRLGGLFILGTYPDLLTSRDVNESAAEFVRDKIRSIVRDPEVAEKLCPTQVLGCKRITVDTDYYASYNRPNVTLIDVSADPIEAFTADGLRTGRERYSLDSVVLATGFDAMTGSLFKIDVRGRNDTPLKEKWAAGPRTYLGLMTAGFPNLFTVSGPGSPSVLSNMVVTIEQHVDWIRDCLRYAEQNGIDTIEASRQAEDAWVDHVNEVANSTLFVGCNSWYLGANVPGKPRIFMPYAGGFPAYAQKCAEVAARGYEGFTLTAVQPARSKANESLYHS